VSLSLTDKSAWETKPHEFNIPAEREFIKHLKGAGTPRQTHPLRSPLRKWARRLACKTTRYSENIFNFANNINTVDGGTP
jgi:DNA gyrase/topoisomerase IV subunit B